MEHNNAKKSNAKVLINNFNNSKKKRIVNNFFDIYFGHHTQGGLKISKLGFLGHQTQVDLKTSRVLKTSMGYHK